MKTVLFSGLAAATMMLVGTSAGANDSQSIDAYHGQPDYGPSMRPDTQAYNWGDDGDVAFASPDGSSYSYDGKWQGEYVDPNAQVFEGEWQGTVTRHGGVAGPGYPSGPGYDPDYNDYQVPRGYEGYERCLKSNGLTGAAIGAVIGGVAGNRIAGRGDRLGGTLLGAGLGGLAGVAIEKATSKCRDFEPGYRQQARAPYSSQGYSQQQHQGWQSGYYYYPQTPLVTVTVVPGMSHTTTTVSEEVYYETVHTTPRKRAIRKWKPKSKARCGC